MKTIIRTSGQGDILDIFAEDPQESDRLRRWCGNNHEVSRIDNLNIWCTYIMNGTWVEDINRRQILKFGYKEKDGRVYDYNGVLTSCVYTALRPISCKEIEEYLIEKAVERGLVAYRYFKWKDEHISQLLPQNGYDYIEKEDALIVGVSDSTQKRAIYMKGQWAIPVFETPKKKLPRTKQDLAVIIKSLRLKKNLILYNDDIDAFLNDYED